MKPHRPNRSLRREDHQLHLRQRLGIHEHVRGQHPRHRHATPRRLARTGADPPTPARGVPGLVDRPRDGADRTDHRPRTPHRRRDDPDRGPLRQDRDHHRCHLRLRRLRCAGQRQDQPRRPLSLSHRCRSGAEATLECSAQRWPSAARANRHSSTPKLSGNCRGVDCVVRCDVFEGRSTLIGLRRTSHVGIGELADRPQRSTYVVVEMTTVARVAAGQQGEFELKHLVSWCATEMLLVRPAGRAGTEISVGSIRIRRTPCHRRSGE